MKLGGVVNGNLNINEKESIYYPKSNLIVDDFNVNDFDEADCPSSSAWEMYLYEQNTGRLHSFHRKLVNLMKTTNHSQVEGKNRKIVQFKW